MKRMSFAVLFGYTGVGGKNTTEFMGHSDHHLQGSLECAEESLALSTVRTLAERVLPCDEHFVQTNCNEFLQWDGVAEEDDVDDDSLAFPWDPGRAWHWQDGSEDAGQFWHDEGGLNSLDETRTRKAPVSSGIRPGSAGRRVLVKESAAPMKESDGFREGASGPRDEELATPTESVARVPRVSASGPREKSLLAPSESVARVPRKFLCLLGHKMLGTPHVRILVGSVETTDERFEVEVPSAAVMDMSGVSAGISVSIVVVVPADNSPPTLRAVALLRATVQRRVCPW